MWPLLALAVLGKCRRKCSTTFNLLTYFSNIQVIGSLKTHSKSTVVQLIERFYDPTSYNVDDEGDDLSKVVVDNGMLKDDNGIVLIDDVDMRKQDIRWLRSNMGYVGQVRLFEPAFM